MKSALNQAQNSQNIVNLGPANQSAYANQSSLTVSARYLNTTEGENFVYDLFITTNQPPNGPMGIGFGLLNQQNSSWYYKSLMSNVLNTDAIFSTTF